MAESSKEFFTADPSHLSILTGLSSIFHCKGKQRELIAPGEFGRRVRVEFEYLFLLGAQREEETQRSYRPAAVCDPSLTGTCCVAAVTPRKLSEGFLSKEIKTGPFGGGRQEENIKGPSATWVRETNTKARQRKEVSGRPGCRIRSCSNKEPQTRGLRCCKALVFL